MQNNLVRGQRGCKTCVWGPFVLLIFVRVYLLWHIFVLANIFLCRHFSGYPKPTKGVRTADKWMMVRMVTIIHLLQGSTELAV